MNILIIDSIGSARDALKKHLEGAECRVWAEPDLENALQSIHIQDFDAVFLDIAVMEVIDQAILMLRRAARGYCYVFVTGEGVDEAHVMQKGANDILSKPYNFDGMQACLENVARLQGLITQIGDDSTDFPSAGGVIAKSAFNQLFVSAVERAGRYGEQSFVLFFDIDNYDALSAEGGRYAADYVVAALSRRLVQMRRQSDIVGQVGKGRFAILLQGPTTTEAASDAGKRFQADLSNFEAMVAEAPISVTVTISLFAVPMGLQPFQVAFEVVKS